MDNAMANSLNNAMDIQIVNKRAVKRIHEYKNKGYTIVDVTSKSDSFAELSPFYPHGNITYKQYTSKRVEGLWQGLKLFENAGMDTTKFEITSMKNIKRKCGKVLGHTPDLLDYVTAREQIYIPAYTQVLKEKAKSKVEELLRLTKLVLLDYDTNEDIQNTSKPLSHASIIKRYLMEN